MIKGVASLMVAITIGLLVVVFFFMREYVAAAICVCAMEIRDVAEAINSKAK